MINTDDLKIIISNEFLQVNHTNEFDDLYTHIVATQVRNRLIEDDYLAKVIKKAYPYVIEDESFLETGIYILWRTYHDWITSDFNFPKEILDRIDLQVKRNGNIIDVKITF